MLTEEEMDALRKKAQELLASLTEEIGRASCRERV